MVQFAPVGSIAVSGRLESKKLLGNYRLLLAHDVIAHPVSYSSVYSKYWTAQRREVTFEPDSPLIIMDNSVVELGSSVNATQILSAVNFAYADVLVLADKLLDANATFAMSLNMSKGIKLHGKPDHLKYMGVVQGRTVEECIRCAANLATLDDIKVLGVPKVLTRPEAVGSRVVVTARITKEFGLPVHLLGFSHDPEDDQESVALPGVLGIDSSLPLRMAYSGLILTHNLNNAQQRPNNDFLNDNRLGPAHIMNLARVRGFFECQTDALDARTAAALSGFGAIPQPTSSL